MRTWARRTAAVALTIPVVALIAGGSASAAEITPIAEYLDATVAGTSKAVVKALAALLGVSC